MTYSGFSDGSHTFQVRAQDAANNVDPTPATYTWLVDTTAPSISYVLTPSAPDGANGWYTSDVELDWTVSDGGSGLASQTGCDDTTVTTDEQATTYSCEATDNAGNSAGPVQVSIQRDATKPTVSLVGGPVDGGVYYYGFVPAAPTCDASDATSGLDGACSVSGYSDAIGSHTVKADAKDMAGNTNEESRAYEVKAWTLTGFYQPVDMNGVYNVVKGGSTVPLKFEVFAGSTELTDPAVVGNFTAKAVACPITGLVADEIEFVTTGGTSLRYDATAGQFIQNWQTPKKSGACYTVTMTTDDGSFITANFKLK